MQTSQIKHNDLKNIAKNKKKVNKGFFTIFVSLVLIILALIKPNETTAPINSTNNSEDTSMTIKVLDVIDGDTIKVLYNGQERNLRLIGIDSPETNHPSKPVQCYGIEAKEFLKETLNGKTITLEKDISETDRYGRLLRYVYLEGIMINKVVVQEGYAHAKAFEPDTKYKETLDKAQDEASLNQRGLWNPNTCAGITE